MEDKKENSENESGKKVRQQITVPFLWEEKPGAPKKDWKPKCKPLPSTHPVPPTKSVASIPFKWEEKPGTPLLNFAQESTEPAFQETGPENKTLPLPPAFFTNYGSDSDGESTNWDDYNEPDWMSDLEAFSINTEESFSSAPSLHANYPAPRETSVFRLQNPFVIKQNDELPETLSSSESATSSSTYAAGNTSLRDALFLQHVFPLYPPKSGFLDKANNSEENVRCPEKHPPSLAKHKKFVGDSHHSGGIRRPRTLQQLIRQSRRRSYRRKAVYMKKQIQPKQFTKTNAQGCFNLGTSGGGFPKLFAKDLQTLKLA